MRIGSLCSGYGGLTLAVQSVLGARVAWHSEVDPAADRVLAARFPGVPNIGDMTRVDWSAVEPVDVLEGGTPCQDVSHAGKRAGMRAGTRSGLWSSMVDAIDVLRPRLVIWENVRGVLSAEADSGVEPCALCVGDGSGPVLRALGRVLGDLADLGYDARWCGLRAADVGAPHGRFRVFVAAQDTNQSARGERRDAAPGQAESGRAWADARGRDRAPVADAERGGRDGWAEVAERQTLGRVAAGRGGAVAAADADEQGPQGPESAGRRHLSDGRAVADTEGDGRHEGWPEPARQLGRSHAAVSGATTADPDHDGLSQLGREHTSECDPQRRGGAVTAWGTYEPAIRRWEYVTGRTAPAPTEPGRTGQRLSPRFVEWMMGLPAGHVTAVPGTTRNDQLKMLGNGVVPQQAQAALEHMLAAS